jgi:GTP-binding protein
LIFTNADKQSSVKTDQNIAKFKKALLATFEEAPDYYITSAETLQGRDEILGLISTINQNFVVPKFKVIED